MGLGIFGASYLGSLGVGLSYLVIVFPFQAAIAHSNPEPALLWLMVPVAGPFLGARTELLRGEPGWQIAYSVVGVLQASGLPNAQLNAASPLRLPRRG